MDNTQNMTLQEKIFLAEKRTNQNLNKIYLFRDSETSTFYKAYEWSAYLLEFLSNDLNEKNRLKPTKKQIKDTENFIIKVGFPITSLDKFCKPELIENKIVSEDQSIMIILKLNDNSINETTYEQLLNNWKDSIQIKQSQNTKQNNINVFSQPVTILSIMSDILKFNAYGKSEDQLIEFIEELKIKFANVIC